MTPTTLQSKITFLGYVHPSTMNVTLPKAEGIILEDNNGSNIGFLDIEVVNSQFQVTVNTSQTTIDLIKLRNSLHPKIESYIDILGFLVGGGFEIEITEAVNYDTDEKYTFPTHFDIYAYSDSIENMNEDFSKLYKLTNDFEGIYFQKSLAEIRRAFRSPFDSPFHAFRSIEFLRQIYAYRNELDPEKDKSKTWQILRDDLGIEKEEIIQKIQNHAKPLRHGEVREFTEESRNSVIQSALRIINLYIDKQVKIKPSN